MQRMERYRGHFYNWYETRTLEPLLPLYVSSVDSGNLAGHLLTLASGLREQAGERLFTPQIFAGLRDTVSILRDLTGGNAALARLDAELANRPFQSARGVVLALESATGQAATDRRVAGKRSGRTQGVGTSPEAGMRGASGGFAFPGAVAALPPRFAPSGRGRLRLQGRKLKIGNRQSTRNPSRRLLPDSRRSSPGSTRRQPCAKSRSSSNRCVP